MGAARERVPRNPDLREYNQLDLHAWYPNGKSSNNYGVIKRTVYQNDPFNWTANLDSSWFNGAGTYDIYAQLETVGRFSQPFSSLLPYDQQTAPIVTIRTGVPYGGVNLHLDPNSGQGGYGSVNDQWRNLAGSGWASFTLPTSNGMANTGNKLFTGWNTRADGNGTQYNAGSTYSAYTSTGQTLTLYAQWRSVNSPSISGTSRTSRTQMTVNGYSQPFTSSDQIKVCSKPSSWAESENNYTCTTVNPSSYGSYDGSTSHYWSTNISPYNFPTGGTYTVRARMQSWDSANSRWVWSDATRTTVTYTVYPSQITLQPNTAAGGQGAAQTQSLNPDSGGHATFTLHDPTYYFTNTNSHATSTGWSTNAYALDAAGATNTNSQTGPFTLTPPEARTLYPVWQTVKQPTFASVTRQSDQTLTVTGSAKPISANDTVEICSATPGTASTPNWGNCASATPYTGTTPDGQASQPWTLTGVATPSSDYYWLRIRLGHQSERGTTWSSEQYAAGPDTTWKFHPNTAQGGQGDDQTVTATPNATTGLSTTTMPKPDTVGGTDGYTNTDLHKVFDGWNTDQNATTGDPTLNPGRTATSPGGPTDRYAIWRTVLAPTITSTIRQTDGTLKISGSSTPLKSGDTVTACTKETNNPVAMANCQSIAIPDNPAGTSNAYDGTTPHAWTITLPAAWYTNTSFGTGYTITAFTTSKDSWRGDGTNTVNSAEANGTYTRPAVTLTLDPNAGTGASQGGSGTLTDTNWTDNAQSLWSDAGGTVTFTYPSSAGMSAPGKLFLGWAENPTDTTPSKTAGQTETFTQTSGTRTITRYAVWKALDAPTGVTATWKRSTNKVTFTASGLPSAATGWQIRYKPNSSQYGWHVPSCAPALTSSCEVYAYNDFTPGATWIAQLRSTSRDSTGATATSAWSSDITGVLPYMDATLKPGSGTGPAPDPHVKALLDKTDGKADLTLPTAADKGMTPPTSMKFDQWNTAGDGSGTSYQNGPVTIPASLGIPDGQATRLTLYAQWKPSTPTATPGHCEDTAGWHTWGGPGQPTPGLIPPVPEAVCWTIDNGDTLRLSGGTSPNYYGYTDIPWIARKSGITRISIEGDLTLTTSSYAGNGPLNNMSALTAMDNGHHTVTLDGKAGYYLFYNDSALQSLDLSDWKTSTLTNMTVMFTECTRLSRLTGLENWDTGNVTDMTQTFGYDQALTSLDLSGWDTSNVTDLRSMFNDSGIIDLDLTGWDTSKALASGTYNMASMMPANLQRFRLGEHTRFAANTLNGLDPSHTWTKWDWPKGHHPSNPRIVGNLTGLQTNTTSATPQGTYVRDDVTITYVDLKYDLAGGTGDASLPTQASTTDSNGLAIDTTFQPGTYTVPDTATAHITANKPNNLFNGWAYDTIGVTGGAATVSNHTITAPKGTGGTATVKAVWSTIAEAVTAAPQVAIDTHATDKGTATVAATAPLSAALPALGWMPASGTDPGRVPQPAVNAGGTVTVCVKPSSQTGAYTGGQCHTKTSSTAGSQTVTPDAFTLPGSLTAGQDTTFPEPGESYVMTASYTTTDPITRNSITSDATAAGGGLVSGTLPWVDASFDANSMHGGAGTPPGDLKSLVDTGSSKAWIQLPYATASMAPAHAVFAGWSASSEAQQPDTGMNDPAHRDIQLAATPGATRTGTTLHAVWHTLAAPHALRATRDPATNNVTITGTTTPWDSRDRSRVQINPMAGQHLALLGYQDTTTSPDDPQGNPLSYDGATEHTWTLTIPADRIPQGGEYGGYTILDADDGAWHDTAFRYAESDSSAINPHLTIPGTYQHQLP
ncbi:BspA family leucine-rich repeat surface protein [Bifidobacterium sp. ESL0682]|uniref:BspA family leucine-rich repeat surface protein n=1 Tax=Bifidobacterium sp. ESL0682 TaxID=2983212 RepID=UPI0023F71E4C|nr:BspA family leucine-rich repeat surface protein [Bifidobacterium sp. ESL0682]WEV41451.1 BspA family leucine-rich repeat surface protein [Bifidobacterium sp. ESL0682]